MSSLSELERNVYLLENEIKEILIEKKKMLQELDNFKRIIEIKRQKFLNISDEEKFIYRSS
jgi:hypothetical protein